MNFEEGELVDPNFDPSSAERSIKILLVDDDEEDYLITQDLLDDIPDKHFELDWVDNYQAGLERFAQLEHDVYLFDYRLGAQSGLDLLTRTREISCRAPVIILTGQGDVEVDQAAQQAGAADYLVKTGLDATLLDRSIRYSLQQSKILNALANERSNLAHGVEERTRELSLANAELAHANKSKDDFLASVSHELRTPLTGILAMSEILGEELYGSLNEKQLEFSKDIHSSGQHLLDLINDILDVAKIDADKMKLITAPVDVNRLCQGAVNLIKQTALQRELSVSLDIDSNLSQFIADEKRLKQILVNLLGNAIKFTPPGGKVGLDVKVEHKENEICFTVWDTGIGIKEQQKPLLFKSFVQLDSNLSRKYAGTGLGLVLVDRLTKLHGGKVIVESEENKGSRFIVEIPLVIEQAVDEFEPAKKNEQQIPQVQQANDLDDSTKPLLLFADDDELNIVLYSEYLRRKDFRVVTATNGREAIEHAIANQPDLILMDLQMPEVDGLTAMRQLRALPQFSKTPIVALTAQAMEGDKEQCIEAGADLYLSKPVSLKKLLNTITKTLNDYRL